MIDEYHAEIDHLVLEMERVDEALGEHLVASLTVRLRNNVGMPPLEYARFQVQAWCAAAARSKKYEHEVLAATLHAIESMTREELATFVRGLVRSAAMSRRPAA